MSVTFIGAGPGPGLITVRGLEALRRADVILYDDLLDEDLLSDPALEAAEKIFVGKRSGAHSVPQEETTALLISKANEGKRVARLKGGDSFVFGRGGEEALALQAAGIPFELVPGVSSAIAVPEDFGIPVTHRGIPLLYGRHRPHRRGPERHGRELRSPRETGRHPCVPDGTQQSLADLREPHR